MLVYQRVTSHLGMFFGAVGVTIGYQKNISKNGMLQSKDAEYDLEFLIHMYSRCRLLRRSSAAKSMSRYQLGNGFGSCFFRWVERLWEHKLMLLTFVSKKSCS